MKKKQMFGLCFSKKKQKNSSRILGKVNICSASKNIREHCEFFSNQSFTNNSYISKQGVGTNG